MKSSPMYVGLDTATTTGIALWRPDVALAQVALSKGSPTLQFSFLEQYVMARMSFTYECIFVIERLHSYRNKTTVRSLLERSGYIKWSLTAQGYKVLEASPDMVRSHLGVNGKVTMFDKLLPYYNGKRLTADHTDALACAMYQAELDGWSVDWKRLDILDLIREEA